MIEVFDDKMQYQSSVLNLYFSQEVDNSSFVLRPKVCHCRLMCE